MVGLIDRDSRVWAVLGPTNTGKTHLAVERMLGHPTGMIGLPLRLLAREVYDRIVKQKGVGHVALVTGEERIVPASARYFVATVEAMPLDRPFSFIAIDEIQLCADPDRGHIFTDRLLRARGQAETMFLGSDTMRPMIRAMIPGIEIERRERLSTLSYTGVKKITKLARRSAIVAFSQEEVYAIAELIRRHKGGAAVVMGALSPRTRNAQVALYQSGEVDFLVATDAIGMGLNMDVDHVAFASLSKFDGRRHRPLRADEIAQIAGRAGRFRTDGTFGETADCPDLDAETIERVEGHQFEPVDALEWRTSDLDYRSCQALIASLEAPSPHPSLKRSRGAIDEEAFRRLAILAWVQPLTRSSVGVRRLWDACQLPDFRKAPQDEHVHLIEGLAEHLLKPKGLIPSDWFARRVNELDRTDGDIEQLQQRLAAIRTWTYVANRSDWVDENRHWQGQTRVIEDRLSDTLHERLMQRFIDKRTSALLKGLKRENAMEVDVNETGEVTVEGHAIGRLVGLRFQADPQASGLEERAVKNAAFQALRPELTRRLEAIATGGINDFVLSDLGVIIWRGDEIAKLMGRQPLLKPKAVMIGGELAPEDVMKRAQERLDNWLLEIVARDLVPLKALAEAAEGESLKGLARGVAYRVAEAGGVMDRAELDADIKQLSQDDRKALRAVGLRFGRANIYAPALLKPRPARLHALFAFFAAGGDPAVSAPFLPPLGVTSFTLTSPVEAKPLAAAGFRAFGQRAVRLDIVDRIADALFEAAEAAKGPCVFPSVIVSLLGASNEDAEAVVEALGWEKFETTRPVKPVEPIAADPVTEAASEAEVNEGGTPDVEPAPVAEPDTGVEAVVEATPEVAEASAVVEVAEAAEVAATETVTLWRRKRAKPPRTDQRSFKRGTPNRAPNPRPQGQAATESAPREPRPPRPEGQRPAQGERRDGNRPPREGGFKRPDGGRPPHRNGEGRSFAAAPPRPNSGGGTVDPNNPFAVLAALKLTAEPAKPAKGGQSSKKHKGKKPQKGGGGGQPAPVAEPQSE
ncbi:MAG: helicase-related protein [Hyphomonadaceae bacterium]|jgi:ATP-dependent RNA helicase SUPV3L1/SUV3|uniref:helicase-related protein n=1 Tax=Aquidulcibacter sp. TaxID=2052990 RepID=UPI0022CA4FFD|nr:helicase-related protein [Aquidulcibacter sp.]MCZ8209864.1 helicase-related protein [Aquidulcibacter sp.]